MPLGKKVQADMPSAARSIPQTEENKQLVLFTKDSPRVGSTQPGGSCPASPGHVDSLLQNKR